MRKVLLGGLAAAALSAAPAHAQFNLTWFYQRADLAPLAQTPTVLNLVAQSSTRTPQADVNAYDNFFLINGVGRLVVNFDKNLQNKGQVRIPGWIGVARYSNNEILADIQWGFIFVKAKYHMPNALAARVVVYKTLNTQQLVYDYVVQRGAPTSCQEYLFTPATGAVQLGMRTSCYFSLPGARTRSSAGRAGRT